VPARGCARAGTHLVNARQRSSSYSDTRSTMARVTRAGGTQAANLVDARPLPEDGLLVDSDSLDEVLDAPQVHLPVLRQVPPMALNSRR